jgi:hypothetical protein
MKIETGKSGLELIREEGDEALSHESAVTHHIRRLLNAEGGPGRWVRMYPHKCGLTDCRQGVRNTKTDVVYWHGNYQIEDAHKAYNAGAVFFDRA